MGPMMIASIPFNAAMLLYGTRAASQVSTWVARQIYPVTQNGGRLELNSTEYEQWSTLTKVAAWTAVLVAGAAVAGWAGFAMGSTVFCIAGSQAALRAPRVLVTAAACSALGWLISYGRRFPSVQHLPLDNNPVDKLFTIFLFS